MNTRESEGGRRRERAGAVDVALSSWQAAFNHERLDENKYEFALPNEEEVAIPSQLKLC